jgi:hypothetical protein
MKKVIIGLAVGAVMLLVNMLVVLIFHYFVPSIKTEYENQNLFRPWTDPLMSLMFVQPFMTGIILAWIWSLVQNCVAGDSTLSKGLNFGLVYWVVTLPGMLISFSTFPVSFMLIMSWTTGLFFQSICAGVMFAKLLK